MNSVLIEMKLKLDVTKLSIGNKIKYWQAFIYERLGYVQGYINVLTLNRIQNGKRVLQCIVSYLHTN